MEASPDQQHPDWMCVGCRKWIHEIGATDPFALTVGEAKTKKKTRAVVAKTQTHSICNPPATQQQTVRHVTSIELKKKNIKISPLKTRKAERSRLIRF